MRHVKIVAQGDSRSIEPVVPVAPNNLVDQTLAVLRRTLNMDVAFVSEFVGEQQFFRYLDSKLGRSPIQVGGSMALEDGYCKRIVDGRLPQMISDASALPEAAALAATGTIPLGSHIGVPLRLPDGGLYGSLCAFSFRRNPTLDSQHLVLIKAFAELIGHQIVRDGGAHRENEQSARIRSVLVSGGPSIAYQPICMLSDMRIIGAEALARFNEEPQRSPDKWFAEAGEVGLETELELGAIRNALEGYRRIWRRRPLQLTLNSSPRTIVSGGIIDALGGFPADRIILEITEHCHVDDYAPLIRALAPLRRRGVRIAVDDAGSGYASMRHILQIRPHYIKLDISLTRDIDKDACRRALARALIEFASQTDSRIIAEGVETHAEVTTLKELGVHAAQGYLFSRPIPADQFDPSRLKRLALRRFANATREASGKEAARL
jgi:EAL domain-containing protein (putative c-di-GMP-specific phosphodiesterase class I)